MKNIEAKKIVEILRKHDKDREWEQYHTVKDLVCAMNIEAGELLEHFLWKDVVTKEDIPKDKREDVAMEVADVFLYLLYIADKLDLDLTEISLKKMKKNAKKYPIEKSRGNHKKYTDL